MRRRGPLLILAAALVAFVLWRLAARPPAPPPDVLLITLDTTRRDAVGEGTPALDAFVRESACFPHARTPVALTLPAHVTILSGLEPRSHRIHENLAPRLPAERGFPFLQEELLSAGYRTAAFVASPVLGEPTGIAAGFETFEAPARVSDSWSGAQDDVPAEERVKAPIAWLAARDRGRPFFLWVHFYDPHVPYLPFAGDSRRPGTREGDPPAALYAGEVRRMDAAVERLLAAVDPGTIVVVASDHGEGLGEHGEATHGTLCYGSTADVVLAIRAPSLPPGRHLGMRSLADIAPTLREWCGLEARASDGVAMRRGYGGRPVATESMLAYRTYAWGQVLAVSDGRCSLVESGPRLDLFDLESDPGETRPLRPEGHPAYEALDRALDAYRKGGGAELSGPYMAGSPYGHAVRPFAAYLTRTENAALKDPETGFAFGERMAAAKSLIHIGRERRDAKALEQAAAMLRGLAAEDPRNPAPHLYLVHAQGRLGWVLGKPELHRAAARSAREAIGLGYRVAPLLFDLLDESLAAGEPADLRAALEVAVREPIHPDLKCAELAARMGLELERAGDTAGAELARVFLDRCRRLGIGPEPPPRGPTR
ncbi:MAG: sulfatase [Planctomycetes bacterium]|nr:sulfatase [Planctomycetota bacterium]